MVNNETIDRYGKLRVDKLEESLKETKERLQEAEETLEAIRNGAVDGLVRRTPSGNQIFMLKGSEQPYRNLIEEMNEGAILISDNGTILYCNQGFAKLVDAPLDKIMGRSIMGWLSQSSANTFTQLVSNVRTNTGKIVHNIALQTTKNQLIPTHISINRKLIGSITATVLIITDLSKHMEEEVKSYTANLETEISERKKVEDNLRRSEQEKIDYLESMTDGFVAFDKDWRYTYINSNAARILHSSKKELIGKVAIEAFPNAKFVEQFQKSVSSGLPVHFEEHCPEPLNIWYECHCYPAKDGAIVFFSDITERRIAEQEKQRLLENVQREKDKLLSLVNSMTDEVWYADASKKIALVNPSASKEFELDSLNRQDVEGITSSFEVYRADGTPRPIEEAPPLRALNGEVIKNEEEIVKTPSSGELRYRQVTAAPVKDAKGEIIGSVSVVRDITERKKAEQELDNYRQKLEKLVEKRTKQLKDAERLAAIGATAGMVGHDIRNPLQAIVSDLFLLRQEIKDMPETDKTKTSLESVEAIEENIFYINKIVADLQDYARPLAPRLQEVDLALTAEQTLIITSLPENIKVQCSVDKNAQLILADPDHLKRIVSNLALNASQAMPHGGELIIRAFKDTETSDTVLTVKDSGVGIPDDVKAKLFTPMFTTKSKGQGFGLVVVKRMTEALGGTVSFESKVGKGTTFIVRLPPQRAKR